MQNTVPEQYHTDTVRREVRSRENTLLLAGNAGSVSPAGGVDDRGRQFFAFTLNTVWGDRARQEGLSSRHILRSVSVTSSTTRNWQVTLMSVYGLLGGSSHSANRRRPKTSSLKERWERLCGRNRRARRRTVHARWFGRLASFAADNRNEI